MIKKQILLQALKSIILEAVKEQIDPKSNKALYMTPEEAKKLRDQLRASGVEIPEPKSAPKSGKPDSSKVGVQQPSNKVVPAETHGKPIRSNQNALYLSKAEADLLRRHHGH